MSLLIQLTQELWRTAVLNFPSTHAYKLKFKTRMVKQKPKKEFITQIPQNIFFT